MKRIFSLTIVTALVLMFMIYSAMTEVNTDELKKIIKKIPGKKIALLPPDYDGPAFEYAEEIGLIDKLKIITPEQLVDPDVFNAKKFPVAIYMGGEHYITTVKTEEDGKDGIKKYLSDGGLIVYLSYEPWPMYYEIVKGDWTDDENIFIEDLEVFFTSFEEPDGSLLMKFNKNQDIIKGLPEKIKFPESGDLRLRAIDAYNITYNAKLTSILTVIDHGDAIGYIEFVDGRYKGGKILYVWSTLLNQDYGEKILSEVFKYIAGQFN